MLTPLSSPAEYSVWHTRKLPGFASIPAARSAGNATTARCAGTLAAVCLPDVVVSRAALARTLIYPKSVLMEWSGFTASRN
jgi:hypothetical protein